MPLKSLRLALIAGFALPLGLATASLAQDAPPPAATPGATMHHEHHWDPAKMREHMVEHLRTVLQLTPAQEPALNAFLASMKPPGDMQARMDGKPDEMQHLTTPERLDKMAARLDQARARIAAVRTFYAQLSPAQQKAFDVLGPTMMHHGMHGHGGMGHHHGMDHHGMGDHGGADGHPMGPGGQPPG